MSRYIRPTSDTTWPDPEAVGEIEYRFRYGGDEMDRADRLYLASICAAYYSLAKHPCGRDQLERLRCKLGGEGS